MPEDIFGRHVDTGAWSAHLCLLLSCAGDSVLGTAAGGRLRSSAEVLWWSLVLCLLAWNRASQKPGACGFLNFLEATCVFRCFSFFLGSTGPALAPPCSDCSGVLMCVCSLGVGPWWVLSAWNFLSFGLRYFSGNQQLEILNLSSNGCSIFMSVFLFYFLRDFFNYRIFQTIRRT